MSTLNKIKYISSITILLSTISIQCMQQYSKEASQRLMVAIERGTLKDMEEAFKKNANPNYVSDTTGHTPLYIAIDREKVKLLIKHKANVNQEVLAHNENSKSTLLVLNIARNRPNIVQILLQAGAEIDKNAIKCANELYRENCIKILRPYLIDQVLSTRPNYHKVISEIIADYVE